MSEREPERNEWSCRIGLRVRAERKRRGLSLSQLAEKSGRRLSKSRISNYEQGVRRLGLEEAEILAQTFGDVSVTYLLCLDDRAPLSLQELELLRLFRQTDARGRQAIMSLAQDEAARAPGRGALGSTGRAASVKA